MLSHATIGLVLMLCRARIKLRSKGRKWCEKKNIGALRAELNSDCAILPETIAMRAGIQDARLLVDDAQALIHETRRALALHCAGCPMVDCSWHDAAG